MNNLVKMEGRLTQEDLQRTFQQIVDIWIIPEIKRRQQLGWKGNNVRAAQIILIPNQKPLIRLNGQVRATAKIKVNRDIKEGEAIFDTDISDVEEIFSEKIKNSAYIILILFKDKWVIKFDFRYYMETAKEHIEAAREFYESAKENLDKKRFRPFYEECWAVAELLSACNFLLMGQKYDRHDRNIKKMKSWAELGNVKIEFSEVLEKLYKLRDSARYIKSNEFKKEDAIKVFDTLKDMLEFTEKLIN